MKNNLVPKRLSRPDIWEAAEDFRRKYVDPVDTIPVPMEEIIEFKLGLTMIPLQRLKSLGDIEGFLSCNLKTIYVDADTYNDPRYENRLRFTFAHEVGHLVLHAEEIKKMRYRNSEDWIKHNIGNETDTIDWFEKQAKQFAGRLLVPKNTLIDHIEQHREKIDSFRETYTNNEDLLIDTVSRSICKPFGVSFEVIKRRIFYEKIKL